MSLTRFSLLLMVLIALIATISSQITIISSGVVDSATTTHASFIWSCSKCAQTDFKIVYPTTLPESASIRAVHRLHGTSTTNNVEIKIEEFTAATPTTEGEVFKLAELQNLVTTTTIPAYTIQTSFFITMKWTASQQLTFTEPTALKTTLDFLRADATVLETYEILTYWGHSLARDPNLDPPSTEINPLEFSSVFTPIPTPELPKTLEKDSTALRTSVTFTNYSPHPITSIDLALTGPFFWYANTTNWLDQLNQREYCEINGVAIRPRLPFKNNQTLTLQIPTAMPLDPDTLVVINCGLANSWLELVTNSLFPEMTGDLSGVQTLTVLPTFGVAAGQEYPQSVYTFKIDKTTLDAEAKRTGTRARLYPILTHVDERLKEGQSTTLSAVFSVEVDSIEDLNRPVQISFQVSGLAEKTEAERTNQKAIPRAIVTVEPDYSIELAIEEDSKPRIPLFLRAPSFIVPLSQSSPSAMSVLSTDDSWSIPSIQLDEGLFITYEGDDQKPTTFPGKLPNRFISIVIPQDAVKIVQHPLDIRIALYFPSTGASETDENSYTIVSVIRSFARTPSDTRPWKPDRIRGKQLEFDVVKGGLPSFYPETLSATFPALKYRFVFQPTVAVENVCSILVEECTSRSVTRKERVCTGRGTHKSCRDVTRTRRITSCSYDSDSSMGFKMTHLSQNRVDMSLITGGRSNSCGTACDSRRRVKCPGTWIVDQQPYVYDLRSSSPTDLITTASIDQTKVSYSWALLQEGQVSALVAHTFSRDGQIVGYSEQYNMKSGLSTGAIIALALIPLYLIVIVIVIVIVIAACNK